MKLHRRNLIRFLLNVLLFASVIWLPWWAVVLCALPLLFGYRAYEVLVWGVLADMLYATPVLVFANLPLLFSMLFLLLFLAAEYSKRFLVFY